MGSLESSGDTLQRFTDNGCVDTGSPGRLRIAIVGLGPRGLAVLERLAVQLAQGRADPVTLYLIDSVHLGGGRIWQPDQSPWFLMNTVVGELTLFSGASDGGPCRPGAGCDFHEWLQQQDDPALRRLDRDDYAPRYVYGRYLRHVYEAILASLPSHVDVHEILGSATTVRQQGAGYRLGIRGTGDRKIDADAVVLATGHCRTDLNGRQKALADSAASSDKLRYIPADNPGDMPLDGIAAGSAVGVIGLGLSFYDVLMRLTVGRGGDFKYDADGNTFYIPGGHEPRIVAGSRGGALIATRGINQKLGRPGWAFRPRFFTGAELANRRKMAQVATGRAALDFDRDVFPLLLAEMTLVYYTTYARMFFGVEVSERLAAELAAVGEDVSAWQGVIESYGLGDVPRLDLDRFARPFAETRFQDRQEFRSAFRAWIEADLRAAALGNVDGPLKAAIDVLRDARDLLRDATEFAGLCPRSYESFVRRFFPVLALLSTGPPALRTEQFLALFDAGVVDVVGPNATFAFDSARECFVVSSMKVADSDRYVTTLIDGRTPRTDVSRSTDPLLRQLLSEGIAREFVNHDAKTQVSTGGMAITRAEYRVVSGTGRPHSTLYALGIPTEGPKWFTQIGNGRPGVLSSFHRDAEMVVVSLLRRVRQRSGFGCDESLKQTKG